MTTPNPAQTPIPRTGFNPMASSVSARDAIARVKYSHDAMIDFILADPTVSQAAIAAHFGYGQAWVSRIMNSDAFQARLAARRADIIDTTLVATVDERFKAVINKSLDVVLEKLHTNPSFDVAIKAAEVAAKAMGYGAKPQVNIQNNILTDLKNMSDQELEERLSVFQPSPARAPTETPKQLADPAAVATVTDVDSKVVPIRPTGE